MFSLIFSRHIGTSLDTRHPHLFGHGKFAPFRTGNVCTFGHNMFTPFGGRLVCTSSVTTHLQLFGDDPFAPFSDYMFAPLWWCSVRTLLVVILLHLFGHDMVAPLRLQHICTSFVTIHLHLFCHDTFAPLRDIIRLLIFSKAINNFIEVIFCYFVWLWYLRYVSYSRHLGSYIFW